MAALFLRIRSYSLMLAFLNTLPGFLKTLPGFLKTLPGLFTVGEAEAANSSFATLAFLVVFRVLIKLFFSMDIRSPYIVCVNLSSADAPEESRNVAKVGTADAERRSG